MPTNPNGALGSLDYKKEERRVLAVKSREAAPKFGNPERQKLIDEVPYFQNVCYALHLMQGIVTNFQIICRFMTLC